MCGRSRTRFGTPAIQSAGLFVPDEQRSDTKLYGVADLVGAVQNMTALNKVTPTMDEEDEYASLEEIEDGKYGFLAVSDSIITKSALSTTSKSSGTNLGNGLIKLATTAAAKVAIELRA